MMYIYTITGDNTVECRHSLYTALTILHACDVYVHMYVLQQVITRLSVGTAFTLALTDAGELYGWGRNDAGQLGLGGGMSMDVYAMENLPRQVCIYPQYYTILYPSVYYTRSTYLCIYMHYEHCDALLYYSMLYYGMTAEYCIIVSYCVMMYMLWKTYRDRYIPNSKRYNYRQML
jgi:Regulator of chromosome condensation (RCC1) repeat